MRAEDLLALLAAWSPAVEWSVPVAIGGTNNLSWRVEGPEGTYVLRVYQNTTDPDRVRYEHSILAELQQTGLSFQVGAPVPTPDGATLVAFNTERGPDGLASLYPLLPGEHPEVRNPAQARAAGRALGELDHALAGIPCPKDRLIPIYGELEQIHPLVPNPLALPATLPLDADARERLLAFFARVMESVPFLYEVLPRQLIHSDYCRPNVLMVGDRVSGVLDFEFVGHDVRVMDLAAGLYHFGFVTGEDYLDMDWDVIGAFCTGYAAEVRLDPIEVESLPTLLRLRRAMSLTHRAGRWHAGLTPKRTVRWQAGDMLALDEWLKTHSRTLVASTYTWLHTQ